MHRYFKDSLPFVSRVNEWMVDESGSPVMSVQFHQAAGHHMLTHHAISHFKFSSKSLVLTYSRFHYLKGIH